MGNLTLSRLLLDGAAVAGGVYSYSDWDPNHTPLFAVGSSGTTPPSFVSLFEAGDTFVWSYSTRWVDASGSLTGLAEMAATLLVAVLVVTALVMWKTRRPPGRARG